MKKIIFAISIIIIAFVSCESDEKFLEEELHGKLFPDNFMNNEQELKMMNNGMFFLFNKAMTRPYESMEIKFASADDVIGTGNQRAYYNEMEVNMEVSTGGDGDIQRGWERCYNAINQANAIILNYQNAAAAVDEKTLNSYAAQAHFVRAFTYFWLVRFFNNIPLIETSYEIDKTVKPAKAADVYALIISDLQFAEEWLPIKWDDAILKAGGAPTKGAAKATLAKVYLQMAGFPINGGTEYYAKARDKAKEVIDNAGEYGYALRNRFYEVWDPYWVGGSRELDEPILWFEHDTDRDTSVRAPNPSRPIELGGWESMIAEMGFYNRFPEGERKDFTFVTDFYIQGGEHYTYMDLKCKHPAYRKMWADDLTPDWEWEKQFSDDPEERAKSRWLTGMETSGSWYSTRPTIVMRYADILLTYAEAKARTDGPDELAYKCLNDVRNRAYKGLGTTEASVSGLSKDAFIDAVVWERAYEFCGFEHSARWFDLQRLELVEKANTEWREETEDKYKLKKAYTKKDYFLPIPSKEVIINPNLANNNPEFN